MRETKSMSVLLIQKKREEEYFWVSILYIQLIKQYAEFIVYLIMDHVSLCIFS
jgi:hypothetical protein